MNWSTYGSEFKPDATTGTRKTHTLKKRQQSRNVCDFLAIFSAKTIYLFLFLFCNICATQFLFSFSRVKRVRVFPVPTCLPLYMYTCVLKRVRVFPVPTCLPLYMYTCVLKSGSSAKASPRNEQTKRKLHSLASADEKQIKF